MLIHLFSSSSHPVAFKTVFLHIGNILSLTCLKSEEHTIAL